MPQQAELAVEIKVRHVDVKLRVAPGTITALFGPSGAGKSTTLGAIAGLIIPERGRVSLGRVSLGRVSLGADAEVDVWFDSETRVMRPVHLRQVAYVFQSLALFPHMSALDNVAYGVARELTGATRRDRAQAALTRMRVGHVAQRRPATLSGGEQQRVALARAFAMEPKVMLLDEAFSAMDRDLRRELSQDVRRYVDDTGIPAIVVTHHRNEARAMADRAVLIDEGRVIGEGNVDEMLPMNEPHPAARPS